VTDVWRRTWSYSGRRLGETPGRGGVGLKPLSHTVEENGSGDGVAGRMNSMGNPRG